MTCHLIMDPYRHLRLHSLNTPFHTTAGLPSGLPEHIR